MALTQVRAQIQVEWYTLIYNPDTGRYEVEFTAQGTSFHQPGGYYPATVEMSNDSGRTESITSDILKSLRLVVQETVAPTLTLISPLPGWIATNAPTLVFEAKDEEDGSGINPDSFTPSGAIVELIQGGYRFTWTPTIPLKEGPNTITASVADNDGNISTVSAAYSVDSVPPEISLIYPDAHRVVDVPEWLFQVKASDSGSGLALVTAGGVDMVEIDGVWTLNVPLEIGENYITVTATDMVGNQSSEDVYMIRLITDRVPADAEQVRTFYLRTIAKKSMNQWTAAEKEWFFHSLIKGAYNYSDFNRVGIALHYLKKELAKHGFAPYVNARTDWTIGPIQPDSTVEAYRKSVESVGTCQKWIPVLEIPSTMDNLTTDGANQLEKILVHADSYLPRYKTMWTSGEITCGEF